MTVTSQGNLPHRVPIPLGSCETPSYLHKTFVPDRSPTPEINYLRREYQFNHLDACAPSNVRLEYGAYRLGFTTSILTHSFIARAESRDPTGSPSAQTLSAVKHEVIDLATEETSGEHHDWLHSTLLDINPSVKPINTIDSAVTSIQATLHPYRWNSPDATSSQNNEGSTKKRSERGGSAGSESSSERSDITGKSRSPIQFPCIIILLYPATNARVNKPSGTSTLTGFPVISGGIPKPSGEAGKPGSGGYTLEDELTKFPPFTNRMYVDIRVRLLCSSQRALTSFQNYVKTKIPSLLDPKRFWEEQEDARVELLKAMAGLHVTTDARLTHSFLRCLSSFLFWEISRTIGSRTTIYA